MDRHAENTNALAAWLSEHPQVDWVSHPSLASHPGNALALKYFRKGHFGAVLTFGIKGGVVSAMVCIYTDYP